MSGLIRGKQRRVWRKRLLRSQEHRCYWCDCEIVPIAGNGQPFNDEPPFGHRWATFDHLVPLAAGGETKPFNLVMACHVCNQERGQFTQVSRDSETPANPGAEPETDTK